MASNIARAVGIRRESQIRTRVATDFFLVQLQRGIDRTALAALGERLGGEGVLRLVIWSVSFWACRVGYRLAVAQNVKLTYLLLRRQRTFSRWLTSKEVVTMDPPDRVIA